MDNKNMKENETCEDCFAGMNAVSSLRLKTSLMAMLERRHTVEILPLTMECREIVTRTTRLAPKAHTWTLVASLQVNVATGPGAAR